MVNMVINGKKASVPEGTTILNAAKSVGVEIPTLCYLKDVCEAGACRMCVVEIEGDQRLSASCNIEAQEGMAVLTHSARALAARQTNLQLLLSNHNVECTTCVRNATCKLQKLSAELNIQNEPYVKKFRQTDWPEDYPLIRDASKCVKCMRCMKLCEKVQALGIWDISGSAAHLTINVNNGQKIKESKCALCGQCIVNCPVGALRALDDTDKVIQAIHDPEKIVIMQIAPAIRTAWAEEFGLDREDATPGKIVAAARALGVDYVFDTVFAADLTIMEEGSELLQRLGSKEKYKWPMFTSCCPGWVRYLKGQYPELIENLSTAKSPQQMFGAVIKTWFAHRAGIDAGKIVVVSIMPCVAKKHECALPDMNDAKHGQDVDIVITNREFAKLIRNFNVKVDKLKDEPFDDLLGEGTGAGIIFGATGGVMEAALRSAYYLVTGKNPAADAFSAVRANSGAREAAVEINGIPVRAAIASGLGNAKEIIEKIKSGKAQYDFVEIMACPGGCSGGGGQPIEDGAVLAPDRNAVLYDLDKKSGCRFSHENPAVAKAYEEFFEKPLSHKSHELLHSDHNAWKMPI